MKNNLKKELKIVLRVAKWEYLFTFLNALGIRLILLVIPILFSELINFVTKQEYKKAIIYVIVSIVVTLGYRLFECLYQFTYYKLYKKLFQHYSKLGIEKTNENSLFSLSRFTLGQYTNMIITDVDILSGFLTNGVIRLIQVIEFLVIFIYFYSIDVYFFIFALIISFIMLFISLKLGKKVQNLNVDRKVELDNMTSSIHEYYNGIKDIKSFNLFENFYPKVFNKVNNYLNIHAKYNSKFNSNNHMSLFIFEFARLLSLIYGIYLVSIGNMEVGTLLIIYNYYQKIIENFNIILIFNVEYRNFKVSMDRFYKLIEYSHPKNNLNIDDYICTGKIELKNILYGFKENPMLNDVSFEISPNSVTALTGSNEATLNGVFDLLLKLNRQHEGTITLDDVDINKINDDKYFTFVSSVRRESIFFDMSIKDNFLMIKDDFYKVVEICEKLGIDDEIRKLKNGYDTIIDVNTPISQSTKELLLFARVLLKDSKIMLFDDLVDNLDVRYESKFIDILNELKDNHTIIIITNNDNILKNVDKVLEISNKKIKKKS